MSCARRIASAGTQSLPSWSMRPKASMSAVTVMPLSVHIWSQPSDACPVRRVPHRFHSATSASNRVQLGADVHCQVHLSAGVFTWPSCAPSVWAYTHVPRGKSHNVTLGFRIVTLVG